MGSKKKKHQQAVDGNNPLSKNLEKTSSKSVELFKSLTHNNLVDFPNLFEIVFDQANIGLSILDKDRKFIKCNQSFLNIVGYSGSGLEGLEYIKLVYVDDVEKDVQFLSDILLNNIDSYTLQVRYNHKNGMIVWVNLSSTVTRNNSGEVELIINVIEDITEKKKLYQTEEIILGFNSWFESLTVDGIIFKGLEEAVNVLDSPVLFFYLIDKNLNNSVENMWYFDKVKEIKISDTQEYYPFSQSSDFRKCLKTQKPRIGDVNANSGKKGNNTIEQKEFTRALFIPVICHKKVVAILGTGNKKSNYTELDVKTANLLANYFWNLLNRKRTETKLKENENNFEAFFNSVDDFLLVLDESGAILEANDSVVKRLGYVKEDLIGQSILMLHPEKWHNEAVDIISKILAGESSSCSLPLQSKDGEAIPVETRVSKGIWNNEPVIFGISKDLSKLRYSEEKFSKVFHVNPAICAIINLYTDSFLDVNDTFLQKLMYKRELLLNSKISELFKLSESIKNQAFTELKETGRINNIDVNLLTATGEEIPVLLSGETVVLGGLKYLYVVGIDISDKVESEKRLKLSEMRLKEAESIAQIGHYSLNVTTGAWESSESLNNIFGIDDSYTTNLELWQELLAPEFKQEMVRYFQEEVVFKHNKFDKEYQIVTKNDGTLKWVHGRGVLKFNSKNEVTKMVGTIQDITKIKMNQLRLQESENALKQIIHSTMGKSGQDYLDSITHSLSKITMADCTFIAEKVGHDSVKTVSAYQPGNKMSNFSYNLKGTPCDNVISKISCVYTEKVSEQFPKDILLKELEAEAYIGTPIFDQNADDIGIIVSLFKRPLADTFFIQSIFEICSSSIGSEMQRTRAELRILENEQTMNTIFDNAPFIMMLLDDNAEIVKINKTGINLKNYSGDIHLDNQPEPLMGCFFDFSSDKGCGKTEACSSCSIMNIYNETLRTGHHAYKSEAELITLYDDKEFQHTFLISSSRVEREGRYFVLLTLDDITESKMMEQKMYENEITLNKIFDNAPVIMMLVNENSEIIKINRAAYDSKSEKKSGNLFPECKDIFNCVGNDNSTLGHENDLCSNCIIKDTLEITLETGLEVFKKEVDIITVNHAELKLKTYLISSTLIDRGKGRTVLLTLDDITDRKRTEEELKQSKESSAYNEKRYRLLSNLTFEGILLHQNRRIIDANRALLKMTGYSYSEIIGQHSMSFLFPAEYESFFIQKLTEEHSPPYETVIIKKNGNRIPVEIESRYFKQNNQRIRVSAIRDIGDRKVMEKKVLQAVMQTEENERARFAQELHDGLGPILSNVQMYFQWLAEEDDNKQFVYEKGCVSLKNAFSTLREISNKLSPHILHNFGLLQAVNNFIDSLVSKNIRIDVQTNIESVRFSPNIEISLYRIITELINNSLKYSSATLIKLEMLLEMNLLYVVYSDNGKGFNISEIQKTSKGYGMINISNRIKTLQGKIEIKSQEDKGVLVEIKVNINKH